jgi:hypothetical protein
MRQNTLKNKKDKKSPVIPGFQGYQTTLMKPENRLGKYALSSSDHAAACALATCFCGTAITYKVFLKAGGAIITCSYRVHQLLFFRRATLSC